MNVESSCLLFAIVVKLEFPAGRREGAQLREFISQKTYHGLHGT